MFSTSSNLVQVPLIFLMFSSRDNQHERLRNYDNDEQHPLDKTGFLNWFLNDIFYGWIWRYIKIGEIDLEMVPSIPKNMDARISYDNWQKVKSKLKKQNGGKEVSTIKLL